MQVYLQKFDLNTNKNYFNDYFNDIPPNLLNKIQCINNTLKKTQRINGLQLIEKMIVEKNLDNKKYNLETLKISAYGKPFFDSNFDFSLSYSENFAVLGFQENGKIGIDIEFIKPIKLSDFNDYFNKNELNFLNNSNNLYADFYKLWTRKEAVSKAIGLGFHIDYKTINSLQDNYIADSGNWQIESKLHDNNYWISTAILVN